MTQRERDSLRLISERLLNPYHRYICGGIHCTHCPFNGWVPHCEVGRRDRVLLLIDTHFPEYKETVWNA